jgi:hypothetical protein
MRRTVGGILEIMNNGKAVFFKVALPLAILVQLAALFLMPSDRFMNMDSYEYLALGQSIYQSQTYEAPYGLNGFESFRGEQATIMRQPGYPVFLTVVYWLLGQNIIIVQLLQIGLNCLTLTFVYLITYEANRGINQWAILFPAIYVPWLMLSSMILAESLFTLFIWASVYLLSKSAQTTESKYYILLGVTLGMGVLIKPIGIMLLLITNVYLLIDKNKISKVLLVCIFTLLILLPWAARNYNATERMTVFPSTSGYNLWVASRPIGSEWWDNSEEFQEATQDWSHYYIDRDASSRFRDIALQNVKDASILRSLSRAVLRSLMAWSRFPGTGSLMGWNIEYLVMSAIHIVVIILAFIGFVRSENRLRWILVLPAIALSFSLPITKGLTRYLLPSSPGVVLLAGQGFLHITKKGIDCLRT